MLKEFKLKDLGEIMTGNTPSTSNSSFYDTKDIMFIKPSDISLGITEITNSNEYISKNAIAKVRLVPKDSLLVSCIGTIGKIAINKDRAAFNQQINAIIPNDKIYSSRYLGYALCKNKKQLEAIANAPVVPIINKSQFSEFVVKIHELDAQKKIVETLDKAQSLIDKRKEQLGGLDQLVKSRFIEMFGGFFIDEHISDFMSLCEKITDGEHGTVPRFESGIQYLMARNVSKENRLDFGEVSFIDEITHKKINSRCNPEYNDLLIVCVGATIGKVALVPKMNRFSIARSVALIKYKRANLNGKYLLWLFNHEYMQIQLKNSSNESAQAGLYIGKIKNLKIPTPPLELQNQFASFVNQVDKLKFEMEKSLKELENNFNSLMQKAFNGELFN